MKSKILFIVLSVAVGANANWRADVSTVSIPKKAVSGQLHGKAFTPRVVLLKGMGQNSVKVQGVTKDRAQAYSLEFSSDAEFFTAQKIEVWFAIDPGESLNGKSIVMRPYAFGTEEARNQSYGNRKSAAVPRGVTAIFTNTNPSKMESFSDRFSVRLEFGRRIGQTLPGRIYLALPDKSKSFLAGEFFATWKQN